jgi:hypothetical protein
MACALAAAQRDRASVATAERSSLDRVAATPARVRALDVGVDLLDSGGELERL